jgi:xanthine dehydrogenase YagS FAD-binding subunit
MLPNFTYVKARTLKEATKQLSSDDARLYAGGTDLLGCLRDRVFGAEKVVSISRIKELRGIHEMADGLRIGSLTTVTEVAANPVIKKNYPVLSQAAASVGSPQLRNQGTIGGNICQKPRCWYYRGEFHCLRKGGDRCYAVGGENQFHCILGGERCYIVHPSDIAAALVSIESSVRIAGPQGSRTVSLKDFYVPPSVDVHKENILAKNEIVTEIIIPPAPPGLKSSYRKVRARRSWDFAIAGVALALQFSSGRIKQARVVLSAAGPMPWQSKDVEEVLTDKRLTSDIVADAVNAVMKNAQPLAKNGYKIPLFQGILEEELTVIALPENHSK